MRLAQHLRHMQLHRPLHNAQPGRNLLVGHPQEHQLFHGDAHAPAPLDPLTLPASLRKVTLLAARGLTDREMASEAGIPLHTVRTYVKRLYARVGVHNRVELAGLLSRPR